MNGGLVSSIELLYFIETVILSSTRHNSRTETVLLDKAWRLDVYKKCMANAIEPFYAALGSKIQKIRDDRKMTQAQLGHSLNPPSTRASIANIENGKQRVLVHTLVQLAKVLDVRIDELLPAAEQPQATPTDVARELRRKLKLGVPELKKLGITTNLSATAPRKRA